MNAIVRKFIRFFIIPPLRHPSKLVGASASVSQRDEGEANTRKKVVPQLCVPETDRLRMMKRRVIMR